MPKLDDSPCATGPVASFKRLKELTALVTELDAELAASETPVDTSETPVDTEASADAEHDGELAVPPQI